MANRKFIEVETVDALIRDQAAHNPDRVGLIFEGREFTYAEMNAGANRAANAFAALGLGHGDRIIWLAQNIALFWDVLFGAAKIGAVLTPINWRLAPPEIAQIIGDAEAGLLVGEAAFIDPLKSVDGFTLPRSQYIGGGETDFDSFVAAQSDAEPDYQSSIDDVFVQLYTSGTTGLPKGVLLTHRCYANSAAAGAQIKLVEPQSDDEAALHTLPHFHVAGVNFGIMSIARSMPVIQHKQFDPGAIVDMAQQSPPLSAFLVPAMIAMLLQAAKEKNKPLRNFVNVSYGAAPMPEPLLDAAMAAMPNARWTQFYGATETTGGVTCLSHDDHAKGQKQRVSAGKPYPGSEVRIVDPETRKEVVQGETGEILSRSGFLMQGYWNRPDATAEVLNGGWYATGDAGYIDENGFIYVSDRLKDMIISGGENIYPAELENVLTAHPAIAEVAVVGAPDDKWGEIVKVVAVKHAGAELDGDGVVNFLSGKIAKFKMPRCVEFIDALPRNPSGKVLKTELRKAPRT